MAEGNKKIIIGRDGRISGGGVGRCGGISRGGRSRGGGGGGGGCRGVVVEVEGAIYCHLWCVAVRATACDFLLLCSIHF